MWQNGYARDCKSRYVGSIPIMISKVYIDRHIIKANTKTDDKKPPISIRQGGKVTKAWEVEFTGPAKLVYRPEKPLSCGATVWIETKHEITAH